MSKDVILRTQKIEPKSFFPEQKDKLKNSRVDFNNGEPWNILGASL